MWLLLRRLWQRNGPQTPTRWSRPCLHPARSCPLAACVRADESDYWQSEFDENLPSKLIEVKVTSHPAEQLPPQSELACVLQAQIPTPEGTEVNRLLSLSVDEKALL
eukprot:3847930-Rhodomonas_salina.2